MDRICPTCNGNGSIDHDRLVYTGNANTPDGYEIDGLEEPCPTCDGYGHVELRVEGQFRVDIEEMAHNVLYRSIHEEVARGRPLDGVLGEYEAMRRERALRVLEALGKDAREAVIRSYRIAREVLGVEVEAA